MTCNYLKNFKDQLKPVNSTLVEFFEYINNDESIDIYKLNILEIGVGIGRKSINLSKLFDHYYGIEENKEFYKIFKKQCKKHDCKIKSFNIDFYSFISKCGKTKLKFDLIFLENTIHFLDFINFFEDVKKIINLQKFIIIKNPKAIPYGWGAKIYCKDDDLYDKAKWIKFKTKLKNIYSELDKSKYLKKKISDDYSHYYLFQI